mmetsp:Transcript_47859/g.93993  ORF Transcript_47859/g.93993 Transcript_47859/m.93993 type:complete len:103 (-) Transcript_47859:845-1153(-)
MPQVLSRVQYVLRHCSAFASASFNIRCCSCSSTSFGSACSEFPPLPAACVAVAAAAEVVAGDAAAAAEEEEEEEEAEEAEDFRGTIRAANTAAVWMSAVRST